LLLPKCHSFSLYCKSDQLKKGNMWTAHTEGNFLKGGRQKWGSLQIEVGRTIRPCHHDQFQSWYPTNRRIQVVPIFVAPGQFTQNLASPGTS
jgi:hypothetical protein